MDISTHERAIKGLIALWEEMTLFRKTWCTFDYTSAEYAVEGGKYQRKHTLSDGDEVCDMRWFINK